jgi:hypothetical protein
MTPGAKRAVWRRITMEDKAWRFNRYAERALEPRERPEPPAPADGDPPAGVAPPKSR